MYGSEPQLLLVEKDLNYGNLMKGYFQALHFNVVMVFGLMLHSISILGL